MSRVSFRININLLPHLVNALPKLPFRTTMPESNTYECEKNYLQQAADFSASRNTFPTATDTVIAFYDIIYFIMKIVQVVHT